MSFLPESSAVECAVVAEVTGVFECSPGFSAAAPVDSDTVAGMPEEARQSEAL